MQAFVKLMFSIAMLILGTVSICTTYISLNDSILPEPKIAIRLTPDFVWNCSILALGMSVAIGLMLIAIKMAVIDGHKRLNVFGIIGLTLIAFISISFNLDVLYRWADQDFFINYSNNRMKSAYEDYLVQAQGELTNRRGTLRKEVAKQEGELDAEIRGLREAPEGYGRLAKQEDYRLTVLQKTNEVEIQAIDEAMAQVQQADALLASTTPEDINAIEQLQHEIRVAVKDVAAACGIPLPAPVKLESPLFAVFAKLFDLRSVGVKEIFVLIIAFLLDLGDILGYSLVPNRKRDARGRRGQVLADLDDELLPPHLRAYPKERPLIQSQPEQGLLESAPRPVVQDAGPTDEPDADLPMAAEATGEGVVSRPRRRKDKGTFDWR